VEALDVPRRRPARPSLGQVAAFVEQGLEADNPVAFLNLDNGSEKQLDKWHWVTITGIERGGAPEASGGQTGSGDVHIDILDNCSFIRVNLGRWLKSSKRGGGFVKFEL
jgi:hypothetical protein